MTARTVRILLACLIFPASVWAQTVGGVVVDASDGRPIVGAVVLLLDSANGVAARGLTNDSGAFRLVAAGGATFRIRALRIGFRPFTSEPITVPQGGEVAQRLVLGNVPVSLGAIAVQGRSTCRLGADSALGTFTLWEQARTALTAADLASRNENVYVRLVTF